MQGIGVIEGFFGAAWSNNARKDYAEFLSKVGGAFYIYAPKQDPHLRKAWRESWDQTYVNKLRELKNHFQSFGIRFGVGFSPFGLGLDITSQDEIALREKLGLLQDIGIDMLGLFFDDMPTNENLAKNQMRVLAIIQDQFKHEVIFCPSYYSFDPILEKVFGKMPPGYLNIIGKETPQSVSIAWTGPKVISPIIEHTHLEEVIQILKRKPFIWENLFANDGPRNCKFLKLKSFVGRDNLTFSHAEAFGLNMMNQAELSKITFLSSKLVLIDRMVPEEAFNLALMELCSKEFVSFINEHKDQFLTKGLDAISDEEKKKYLSDLSQMKDPGAREIADWLRGHYVVGSECLTD